jgi:hypothetical protein
MELFRNVSRDIYFATSHIKANFASAIFNVEATAKP